MLYIVTYGTEEAQMYFLRKSATVYGLTIHNLAKHKRWDGYQDKLWGIRDWIASRSFKEEDRILFVDAYDVLMAGPVEEIWSAYRECGSPQLLVAAEKNCFPYPDMADDFPEVNSPYRYLNSGGFMGTPSAILEAINWMEDDLVKEICRVSTDQGYVVRYYLEFYKEKNIVLDVDCRLFNCMIKVRWDTELEFKKGRYYNCVTQTYPCVLHFNGGTYSTADHNNVMVNMLTFMENKADGDLKTILQPPDKDDN